LFNLDPKDAICEKSPAFLKIFQEFFKAVFDSLPPEEKKRGNTMTKIPKKHSKVELVEKKVESSMLKIK